MEFIVDTGKVTKLDMNYPDWSPDMIELFGQKVDVCRSSHYMALFKPNEPDGLLYTVQLENGNCYIIPKDWITFTKKERKTTSYKHKLVCVESESVYFTAGKVYLFDKGVLVDDTDRPWNERLSNNSALTYVQNVEDINKYFCRLTPSAKFIEYVE